MLRLQERGGQVGEDWERGDPHVVEDALKLLTFYSGTATDAAWPFFLSLKYPTPEEIVAGRERQIIQLARHGRQQIDSVERWRVSKILRWYRRLREQIDAETEWEKLSEA